jgi:hypothetical protein
MDIASFITGDKSLEALHLPDKAVALVSQSARLAGRVSVPILQTIEWYMAAVNSYYSNLIEGNASRPHETRLVSREITARICETGFAGSGNLYE